MFALLLIAPAFIYFTEAGGGPGAMRAPVLISLAAGLIVGALAAGYFILRERFALSNFLERILQRLLNFVRSNSDKL